jgi:superfamily II DNA or RNA helicase/SAM-dependent methyltransferase/SOS-response transcriptional repressor LexA
MNKTLSYYDQNADDFFTGTANIDMGTIQQPFLEHIPKGGRILDAGCGSGRDAKNFLELGFRVDAFDGSDELVKRASEYTGLAVSRCLFEEFSSPPIYNGIWACASLLHVPELDLPELLARLWTALRPGGIFYLSFKYGTGEREANSRSFTDMDESRFRECLKEISGIARVETWRTADKRSERSEEWFNAFLHKENLDGEQASNSGKLVTGGSDPFLPHLSHEIGKADEIDLCVSFVKSTGLSLVQPDLEAAICRDSEITGGEPIQRSAKVRILTSDYLNVTDPLALRRLMLLQEKGATVKVFESGGIGFHMKAYIFTSRSSDGASSGVAYIGSSNLSHQALTHGLEWNYRVEYPDDEGFFAAKTKFEELFHSSRAIPLSHEWITGYEQRKKNLDRSDIVAGGQEFEVPPTPHELQLRALEALNASRTQGLKRALVVLATGLGKTWLAAFDTQQISAKRVLFVAHREEILRQAAHTFSRVQPQSRIGYYSGEVRERDADILCASVQTLSRSYHLDQFDKSHFDYIIIDEFHHAAAATYRRVLNHFEPRFLLGLTATPDRTDQSDILSLCDDNLAFSCNIADGVNAGRLAPFHYYGIFDETVQYDEIPWRNGQFDPDNLSAKLATLARAKHALKIWRQHSPTKALAFCMSIKHAEFMTSYFKQSGVRAASVHGQSSLGRAEAIELLRNGSIAILFSVDLFNEGVDIPEIDAVMMLRPTESKIMFLQQLGRGLRLSGVKEKLTVLDFVGNHRGFLHKPQALFNIGSSYAELVRFAKEVEAESLKLPKGCFVNYDLTLIDFLKSLNNDSLEADYEALRDSFGRRPTASEVYRAGIPMAKLRRTHGSWFQFVEGMGDLSEAEKFVLQSHREFLKEVELAAMEKCFKMVLLEAFQELDGWTAPVTVERLAERSWQVLQRRRSLLGDLESEFKIETTATTPRWIQYWKRNPIDAWTGRNKKVKSSSFFRIENGCFVASFSVETDNLLTFANLVQELIDLRLSNYESRLPSSPMNNVVGLSENHKRALALPFFPNLKIACGHFKTGSAEVAEQRTIRDRARSVNSSDHFIACASGNSMNGGKSPIRDGDYLLLEHITLTRPGFSDGTTVVVERSDASGDEQYLLRVVYKGQSGEIILKAHNPGYADMIASADMRPVARLKEVLNPLEMAEGQSFLRESIPPLFGKEFNPGNWNSGHVVLEDIKSHVLLVTISKQGKSHEHRYVDAWNSETEFQWQSQNSTDLNSKRGQSIVMHEQEGWSIHLFVREHKLAGGKAAEFRYFGKVRYKSHVGNKPITFLFELT